VLKADLKLDDAAPFRLSRNHFVIEQRDEAYCVRDLRSTLGTIVNGEPIGNPFRTDEARLRDGEDEVIAGGVGFTARLFRLHRLKPGEETLRANRKRLRENARAPEPVVRVGLGLRRAGKSCAEPMDISGIKARFRSSRPGCSPLWQHILVGFSEIRLIAARFAFLLPTQFLVFLCLFQPIALNAFETVVRLECHRHNSS
jgi:pSer/pThr/pTyr-binding forkhead associated (FHA) protein